MATSKPTPKTARSTTKSSADDRVRRDKAPTARGDRGIDEDAARANQTGLINDMDEFQKLLASEFDQVALPTPPEIPGWHVCWLTTGSAYDTVQKRQRLGYIPVTASELPGFETGGIASAQFGGAITCNEMVLFKISSDRYQMMMNTFHNIRPLEEEENIYAQVQELSGDTDSKGKPAVRKVAGDQDDGFTQLGKSIERAKNGMPVFAP
jgi:hypothetical protein